jgi:hypothetical protein
MRRSSNERQTGKKFNDSCWYMVAHNSQYEFEDI